MNSTELEKNAAEIHRYINVLSKVCLKHRWTDRCVLSACGILKEDMSNKIEVTQEHLHFHLHFI